MEDNSKNLSLLPAFTLLEVIISMIVGSIIISMVYIIFGMIKTSWDKMTKDQYDITILLLFKSTIDNDIDKATYIQFISDKRYRLVSEKDTVVYIFDKSIIRVKNHVQDSFEIATKNVGHEYALTDTSTRIVNDICLEITDPVLQGKIHFYKYYSCQELLAAAPNY